MGETVLFNRFHVGVDYCWKRDNAAVVVMEQQMLYRGKCHGKTGEPCGDPQMWIRLIQRVRIGHEREVMLKNLAPLREILEPRVNQPGGAPACVWQLDEVGRRTEVQPVRPMVLSSGTCDSRQPRLEPSTRAMLMLGLSKTMNLQLVQVSEVAGARELIDEMDNTRVLYGDNGMYTNTKGRHHDLGFAAALALYGAGRHMLPSMGPEVRRRARELGL